MIIPRLYGRLGNQAFQVSAAIAHAKKMETTWAIPRVTQDVRIWPNYFLHTVPRENITMYGTRLLHKEINHGFNAFPLIHDMTIDGYFQSEKYFENAKEEIGNALGFHCKKEGYIAVHVRRGDYVTDYSNHHPPLSMEYYTEAMSCFINKGVDHFKIYTDDIPFILNTFFKEVFFEGAPFIEISKHRDPLADMRDMYNASGFIISNSTFSLFPALLRLDNPVVIAPAESRWFGPGNAHMETSDLMPERFIKI